MKFDVTRDVILKDDISYPSRENFVIRFKNNTKFSSPARLKKTNIEETTWPSFVIEEVK